MKKLPKSPTILAIDTSCDETSISISYKDHILSSTIASQANLHSQYGGVVPHLAKREHQKALPITLQKSLKEASKTLDQIDLIAITIGPGLAPALEAGIDFAKKLSEKHTTPLFPINHMEGHLLSSFAKNSKGNGPFSNTKPLFPSLAFLISGGHTQLVLVKNFGKYKLLGQTLDDAAGEAFDKIAKMLQLGYPGGPIIEQLAKNAKPTFDLPIPMKKRKDLNFSFSGLKTASARLLKQHSPLTTQQTKNFAASFQNSVKTHLSQRLEKAILKTNPKQILLGGGVISNLAIRNSLRKTAQKYQLPVFLPYSQKLFTDNAAMISTAAYYQLKTQNKKPSPPNKIDRIPSLSFSKT